MAHLSSSSTWRLVRRTRNRGLGRNRSGKSGWKAAIMIAAETTRDDLVSGFEGSIYRTQRSVEIGNHRFDVRLGFCGRLKAR